MQEFSTMLMQYPDWGLLALRIVIGIIFLVHAKSKLMNPSGMAQGMGWSSTTVRLLGLAETLGGIGVALGILTQLAAIGLSLVMLGAMYHKIFKWKTPFMALDKTGWEFDLLILASNIVIIVSGGGTIKIW